VADFKQLLERLSGIVDREFVRTGPDKTGEYAVDKRLPDAVVFPGNTDEVSKVVTLANRENLAVVPCGSRTKIAMGNRPRRLDLVICTSRMNHMIDVDTSNLTITVEAGVKFRDIQARLATQEDRCYLPLNDLATQSDDVICSDRSHSGCFLPVDPAFADLATIGGIIAANSSGSRRLLYRNIRDSILGVRMTAPTGEVLGSGGKTVKNVSGYDVSKLAVGSMGSLGIICELTMRLLPLPEKMETLLVSFESFSKVSSFMEDLFESPLLPAGVDLLNRDAFTRLKVEGFSQTEAAGYVSAVALEGFEPAVDRMRAEIQELARAAGASSHLSLREERHLKFRLALSNLDVALARSGADLIKARLNYPLSEWAGIAGFVEKTLSDAGLEYTLQIHGGNGISLIRVLVPKGDTGVMDRAVHFLNSLLPLCVERGGNMVIEGAPVAVKDRLRVWGETGSDFVIMKRLKEEIDPSGIMSPGRFVGGL